MDSSNCNNCKFLTKRPAVSGGRFIYKCGYWGLICQNQLPGTVVASSIGKKCPFFTKREPLKNNSNDNNSEKKGFDIIV